MKLSHAGRQRVVQNLLEQVRHTTDLSEKWQLLAAAHVAGQSVFQLHAQTHQAMLALAWQHKNWQEVLGQILRLTLVPLGHATGRLPLGNPGTADVSALQPMPVPSALITRIERALATSTSHKTPD
jgi:hypothetical protein